ncbi:unnamed protein product [Paramecium octaurelia]|uniref:Uncharacterized protein n=1 Tax=Paramecium octaurelia TaxID=43137 RepID=A0A8S1V0G8_PAROT|nr:unnamed protein product [Paramecium octaurelia]
MIKSMGKEDMFIIASMNIMMEFGEEWKRGFGIMKFNDRQEQMERGQMSNYVAKPKCNTFNGILIEKSRIGIKKKW